MFALQRAKKSSFGFFILAALSFIFAFIGFANGGAEFITHGFWNEPAYIVLMFVAGSSFIICFALGFAFCGIQKDIAEHLQYLNSKLEKLANH